MKPYRIDIFHDKEAGVYCASSDDIPGLTVEADTFEALQKDIEELAPQLIEMNLGEQEPIPDLGIPAEFVMQSLICAQANA